MNGNTGITGRLEIERGPSLRHEHAAERAADAAQERKKYFVEKLTLIVVFIYTLINLCLYISTKRSAEAAQSAADTAKKALVASNNFEAAHLAIENFSFDCPNKEAQCMAKFDLVNRGNSIAVNISEGGTGAYYGDQYKIIPNGPVSERDNFYNLTKIKSSPNGFSLAQGDRRQMTFTFPSKPESVWWYADWFGYKNIFGSEDSVGECWARNKSGFPVDNCPFTQPEKTDQTAK